MQEGQLLITQADQDRLVTLKKAHKKLITQKDAATELGITERQVRRLLRALKKRGDKAVIHGLRGEPFNRKIAEDVQQAGSSHTSWFTGFGVERGALRSDIDRWRDTRWDPDAPGDGTVVIRGCGALGRTGAVCIAAVSPDSSHTPPCADGALLEVGD